MHSSTTLTPLRKMAAQITGDVEHIYEPERIRQLLDAICYNTHQEESTDQKNTGEVIVGRGENYKAHQFDLYLLINTKGIAGGHLLLIKDFIRRKSNIAPAIAYLEELTGTGEAFILQSIKVQLQFLQEAGNRNLASAPTPMLSR